MIPRDMTSRLIRRDPGLGGVATDPAPVEPHVLVVEDNPTARKRLRFVFEGAGVSVAVAASGEEALAAVEARPESILVIDYHLGDMNGGELVRALHRAGQHPAFLVVTARGDAQIAVEMMRLGAKDYLHKLSEQVQILPHLVRKVAYELARERRLEQALRSLEVSERRHRELLANLRDVVYAVAPDGTISYISPVVTELTGFRPDELIGRPFEEFVPEADHLRLLEVIEPGLRGEIEEVMFRVRCRDGSVRWVQARGGPQYEDGEVVGLQGVLTDVTARRRMLTRLRLSEERFRSAFYTALIGCALLDLDGNIVRMNHALTALLACDGLALRGQPIAQFAVCNSLPTALARLVQGEQEQIELMVPMRTRSGKGLWCWLSAVLTQEDGGSIERVLLQVLDQTARREAEHARNQLQAELETRVEARTADLAAANAALRRSERSSRLLAAVANEGLAAVDARAALFRGLQAIAEHDDWTCGLVWQSLEGGGLEPCCMWQPAEGDGSQALLDQAPDHRPWFPHRVLDRPGCVALDIPEDPPREPRLQLAARLGLRSALAVPVRVREQTMGVLELFSRRRRQHDDERRALFANVANQLALAVERHWALDVLRQAEATANAANRAKAVFLANMSHEIRTPLNAIIGFSELLMRGDRLPDREKRWGRCISSAARQMLELVDDILDLSEFEVGELELRESEFPLASFVADFDSQFRLRAEERGLAFECTLDVPCERVITDQGRLRQIVLNLLVNALRFTDEGRVRFTLTLQPGTAGFELVGEVEDTGCGIAPEDHERIFESFSQGGRPSRGGTGLGLALCRQYLQALRGSIELESEQGVGSRFRFRLPVRLPESAQEAVEALFTEAQPNDEDVAPGTGETSVTPVPDRLYRSLQEAVKRGETERVESLIEELAVYDTRRAAELKGLAQAFAYDELLPKLCAIGGAAQNAAP